MDDGKKARRGGASETVESSGAGALADFVGPLAGRRVLALILGCVLRDEKARQVPARRRLRQHLGGVLGAALGADQVEAERIDELLANIN